jgi:hypothetical protein
VKVWRREPLGRSAGWVLIGLGTCFAIGGLIASFAQLEAGEASYAAQFSIFVVAGAVMVLCGWLYGMHPKVKVDDAGVTVTNPIRRVEIPWSDIDHARPGRSGVVVVRRSGRTVQAWAMQPLFILVWPLRNPRADELIREINTRRGDSLR